MKFNTLYKAVNLLLFVVLYLLLVSFGVGLSPVFVMCPFSVIISLIISEDLVNPHYVLKCSKCSEK